MTELSWEAIGGLVALIAVGSTIAGAFVGYGRLKSKADQAEKKAERAIERVERLTGELSAFRELAAKEFVSINMLEKVEERVIGAIDRLADRLDRLFESSNKKTDR